MINDKQFMDELSNLGKKAGNILSMSASSEGILTSLLSKRDEMPEEVTDELFNQLDSSLREARKGRLEMKDKIKNIEKVLKQNGNNNSK